MIKLQIFTYDALKDIVDISATFFTEAINN